MLESILKAASWDLAMLFCAGGHGFEVLEEIEMIEVKQGPYGGDTDKRRIRGITAAEARIKKTCNAPLRKV